MFDFYRLFVLSTGKDRSLSKAITDRMEQRQSSSDNFTEIYVETGESTSRDARIAIQRSLVERVEFVRFCDLISRWFFRLSLRFVRQCRYRSRFIIITICDPPFLERSLSIEREHPKRSNVHMNPNIYKSKNIEFYRTLVTIPISRESLPQNH